jgi:vitamin K-dependent gamma-carboxylase
MVRVAVVRDVVARLKSTLRGPVDGASLAVFRIGFGSIMAWELLRYFQLGRVEAFYVAPQLLFPHWGFDWLPRLHGAANSWVFVALIVLALAIACGAFYRVVMPLFFIGYTYFFLLDQTHYQNHLYLFCLLAALLSCVDAHRVWSFDAWRKRLAPLVPGWHVALIAFQLGVVYFFGGINKISHEWLSAAPMDLQLGQLRSFDWAPAIVHGSLVAHLFAWAGLLLDLGAVPLLLFRRTRLFMLAALATFHLSNTVLFSIGVFPWFMLAGTTIFLGPSWPRRFVRSRRPELPDASPASEWTLRGKLLIFAGASYVALQLFLPLRHHLYPGDWIWTRDGEYFSWTMKLNVRAGAIKLLIQEPNGQENEAPLYAFLTAKQIDRLSYTPEMVVRVNDLVVRALKPGMHARWISRISINGRPYQDYVIGDAAELAKHRVSLLPTKYLHPFEAGVPPTPEVMARARLERRASKPRPQKS